MRVIHHKIVYIDVVAKILYVIVFLGIVISGIRLHMSEEFDLVRAIDADGEYIFHPDPLVPRDSPELFLVEDEKLFLFYIEKELINVYSTDGDYLYGFQFPDGQNDRSDMCYQDGLLYVNARGSGIYIFQDTELVRFEEQHYQNEEYSALKKAFTGKVDHQDGDHLYAYVEDTNQIIRSDQNGSETVLQFPERKYDPVFFMGLISLMVLLGKFIWEKDGGSF